MSDHVDLLCPYDTSVLTRQVKPDNIDIFRWYCPQGDYVTKWISNDPHNEVLAEPNHIMVATGSVTFGTAVSVAPNATISLAEVISPSVEYKLHGFSATGNGDGYFFLQVDGATILSGRIHSMQKSIMSYLPIGSTITPGAVVTLSVRNECTVSCDYEGSILGEI